ncbi:3-mercaptopyruvate sulfurtransferase-like [Haliotis rubra]|uniref:3-mercaptopyruvate sulfurtransferase-like n=1 Tax=Haliotis rubra TaxID=36100 RepID=UPI001EE5E86D|nr:3-mercaptopyruvate sulfurtransferase-like [Haliotis rubra]
MNRVAALVSTKWLKDVIASNSKCIRIIDASWHLPTSGRNGNVEFQQKHIPGAQFFDIDECADKSSPYGHMLPSPLEFEAYVGGLGIGNDTHVVVYDNNEHFGLFSAQRVWWTFRAFGHDNVSVLDGGFPKWCRESNLTSSESQSVSTKPFKANFVPSFVKSFGDVKRNIDDKQFQLVDARASGRFQGKSPEPRPNINPGHIPGSVNIPFMSVLDPDKKTMKTEAELRQLFASANIDLSKPLTVSCGSGVSACCIALAAYQCSKEDVSIYDGSWTEWYLRAPPSDRADCPQD